MAILMFGCTSITLEIALERWFKALDSILLIGALIAIYMVLMLIFRKF